MGQFGEVLDGRGEVGRAWEWEGRGEVVMRLGWQCAVDGCT